jgi:hypothetical protein
MRLISKRGEVHRSVSGVFLIVRDPLNFLASRLKMFEKIRIPTPLVVIVENLCS